MKLLHWLFGKQRAARIGQRVLAIESLERRCLLDGALGGVGDSFYALELRTINSLASQSWRLLTAMETHTPAQAHCLMTGSTFLLQPIA